MPSVQILKPSAGEKLYVGTTYNIQWTSSGANNQRIQYSIDGGVNFNPIQTGLAPGVQQFAWVIPDGIVPNGQASTAAIVRILVRDTNGVEAMSASSVTIANAEVTSISPNHGPLAGNTVVNIFGNGFAPGCNIKFGNLDGLNIQVLGSTQIKVTTPAGAAGAVDVKVKNPTVPGITVTGGFTYDPPAAPAISSINPNHGPMAGNTEVSIFGANFDPQVNVKFGNVDGTITQVTATLIKVKSPAAIAAGAVELKVKNPTVMGVSTTFTYDPPAGPAITSINPNHGPIAGNTEVSIFGANFDPQVNVKFGNLDGTITQVTATLIKVKSPAAIAAGSVELKVKNPTVIGVSTTFTYDPPAGPMISSINPTHGPIAGNIEVSIFGANFDPQVNVKFGNVDGTITQVTSTLIKVKSPAAAAAGSVELKVKNPTVMGVSATFTYDPPDGPMISSINPTHGPIVGNTEVSIFGMNFDPQVNVKFGNVDGTITQVTATLIKVKSPAAIAAGAVELKVKNPTVMGVSTTFTYDPPAGPAITSINPNHGPIAGNTEVSIFGANFDPQVNIKFGNVDGTITQVTATLIKVKSPAAIAAGAVELKVKNPNVMGVSATFTYDPPDGPMISSINPTHGPIVGNTEISIAGTNFDPQVNVKFGTLDGTITQVTPPLIKVKTPAATVAGPVDVKVKNPTVPGVTTTFTYDPPAGPTITSITPNHGPIAGNTEVSITGTNFDPQVNVKFGTLDGTITQVTSTLIKVKSPTVTTAGSVELKVKNPTVLSVSTTFTYDSPAGPTITSINPTHGPIAGNTEVSIIGTNFDPQVNVKFGTLDGIITQVTTTLIKVKTPAVTTAGSVELKVKNPTAPSVSTTFTYDSPAGPTITSINPSHGPIAGNIEVSITGTNFDPQVNVKFGTLDGTITQVTTTLIKVKTPAVTTAGSVELKVKNPTAPSVSTTFTYDSPAGPTITSITPNHGPIAGNTEVSIIGTNFDPQVNVKFGTVDGTITQVTPTLIKVKTPAVTTAGAVDVKVKNPTVVGVSTTFTYDSPAGPTITSITPNHGPIAGNTEVSIIGTNFDPQVNVKFGTLDGTITQVTPTLIKVKSPAVTTDGAIEVKVKNPTVPGVSTTFTYDPPEGGPRIDRIEPMEGPTTRSISVVITGANFVRKCAVRFAGVDAKSVRFDNSSQLTVETPKDMMPGLARVKVVNPDQTSAARENGFKFNGPPTIARVDPPEGPRDGGISVNVLGANFQPGVTVRFGNTSAIGTPTVNADGTSVTCVVPPGQKGAVTVTVQNPTPDLQSTSRESAFTYLGPKQEAAARIFSISPKTVLLNAKTTMTVKGRNLGVAIAQGGFAVRGPDQNFATMEMHDLEVSSSASMQEDTVTFCMQFKRPAGLGVSQRVPYYVVASVRPKARANRVFETSRNGQFTLVTDQAPVAFGVTGQLIDSAVNLILLSGRSLKGSTVMVTDRFGASLPISYVNDREDLLLAGITLQGGMVKGSQTGAVSLSLIGPGGVRVGSPISLDVMAGTPTDDDNDVPVGRLKTVPGQQVVTMPPERIGLFAFSGDGDGGTWLPGGPLFPISDFSYQPELVSIQQFLIDLVNESFIVPTFGRATNTKVGLLRRIRALPLIIHLEITLVVTVRVYVFRTGNPFVGLSIGGFNEFESDFPEAFGTYLAFVTSVSFALSIRFLIAIVRPDDELVPLLILDVDFELSQQNRRLVIRGSVVLGAHIRSIRPRGRAKNLLLVAPSADNPPLSDKATFFGWFFAQAAGRGCEEWEFQVNFSNTLLDGTPVEEGTGDGDDVFVVRICTEVAQNPDQNILKITSEPLALGQPPTLDLDTSVVRDAVLHAMLVPVDKDGNPTGAGREIKPPAVSFQFVPQPANSQSAIALVPGPDGRIDAAALVSGHGEIQAAATTGPGMALLPSSVFGFLAPAQGAMGLAARLAATVAAQAEVKVRLDPPKLLRPESFSPPTMPIPPLTLTLLDPLPASIMPDADITFTIRREMILAFPDPMENALLPMTGRNTLVRHRTDNLGATPARQSDIEARFVRFFQGTLATMSSFPITMKAADLRVNQAIPLTNITIAPNQVEDQTLAGNVYTALVPPGGTEARVRFSIDNQTAAVTFKLDSAEVALKVQQEEDHEEYFRVLTECVRARGVDFDMDLKTFTGLFAQTVPPTDAEIDRATTALGDALFKRAVEAVQGIDQSATDKSDRPLYWSRLTARAILKQAGKATPARLKALEERSRGITKLAFEATDTVRVVLTGFDPFFLFMIPERGNPSGLIALRLHDSRNLDIVPAGGPAFIRVAVRCCVFPVRYDDFDNSIVENAIRSLIDQADMVITCSQGSGRYDIEQSSCNNRGGTVDNRNLTSTTQLTGPGFRLTTLPWKGIVTRDDLTISGPDTTDNLIFNQGFKATRNGQTVQHGQMMFGTQTFYESESGQADAFLELPLDPDVPPVKSDDVKPLATDMSIVASTGDYLSNEVFYRVAGLRDNAGRGAMPVPAKTILPMGHFHVPVFPDTGDSSKRSMLFDGVIKVIQQFLFDITRDKRDVKAPAFNYRRVQLAAQRNQPLPISLVADNTNGTEDANVQRIDLCVETPASSNFNLGALPTTPLVVPKGRAMPITSGTFTASRRGTYGLACTLLGPDDVPLFRTDVIAKVAFPEITRVTPRSGRIGLDIKITGLEFVPRTVTGMVEVKFGMTVQQTLTINDTATEISCKVPMGLAPGQVDIVVTTPYGTSNSIAFMVTM